MVERDGNTINIAGDFGVSDFPYALALIHQAIQNAAFQDLNVEFAHCERIEPPAILALITQLCTHRSNGIDIKLGLPLNRGLRQLFINSNWAHFICPDKFDASQYGDGKQLPIFHYTNGQEQHDAVNEILERLLSTITGFEREHFRAIEWALNEITDNVINHAQSQIGGFVQLTSFAKKQSVQVVVGDAGVSIPKTLRDSHSNLTSDQAALDVAIREGVTRDRAYGQGNGLYGSWRITKLSKGKFSIYSRNAKLISNEQAGLHVTSEKIPFTGTLVTLEVPYSQKNMLADALNFGGRQLQPIDLIELRYESAASGVLTFSLVNESPSGFGSRDAGEPVRKRLLNFFRTSDARKILIDFADVNLVSSSYADEVFGKLFAELGPILFSSRFEFTNIDPLVRQLIDRSISQRLSVSIK